MKKILTLGVVALVLITMSSCQFNLFAAFDRIEIPSAAELDSKAGSDPDGFVSDVEDYVENDFLENEDVTPEQEQAIIDNLTDISDGTIAATVGTQQEAAVLVGELEINRDPDTSTVVNGIITIVSSALATGDPIDPETLIADIFPPNLDAAGVTNILDQLSLAAAAYSSFAGTIDIDGDGVVDATADMTSGEVGDMAQYAVVALIVDDLRGQTTDADIYALISTGDPLDVVVTDPFAFNMELLAILDFAGLDI